MDSILGALAGYELYFFIGLAVLVLLIIGILVFVLLRGRRKAAQEEEEAAPAEAAKTNESEDKFLTPKEIRASFRNGLKIYQDYVAGSRNPYLVPWVLMLGGTGSGKSNLLGALEANRPPAETPDNTTGKVGGCSWWYYDRAVVLDVGGESVIQSDGSAAPEAGWLAILEQLRRHRARRPIDGIVLVLPADELYGATALSPQEITSRAHALYARLWQAQKTFGLCLPTYVVVTKCDIVPGFQALVDKLPQRLRDGMFGWSSPYALEAAFRSEWLDEAFTQIQALLFQTEVEVFAETPDPADADELFFFQSRFADMRDGLKAYLNTVFRRTSYQEALFFRGIYFTGNALPPRITTYLPPSMDDEHYIDPAADDGRREPVLASQQAKPVFVRDLFEEKIFAERDLVKDTPAWSVSRNRAQLAWQIGCGVAGLAALGLLWQGWNRLDDLRSGFVPALRALPEQMRSFAENRQTGRGPGGLLPQTTPRAMQDVIRYYSRLPDDWSGPFFPAAWLSSVEERSMVALSIGYHRVVMNATRDQLDRRGRALGDMESIIDLTGRPGMPEQARLRAFLGQMVLFERFAGVFNAINGTGDLTGLPELLRYAHEQEIPQEFLDRASGLNFTAAPTNRALRGASLDAELAPFDVVAYRNAATARLEQLFEAYLARLAAGNETLAKLRQVALDLEALSGPGRRATTPQPFEQLHSNLTEIAGLLAGQDAGWIGGASLTLGPNMQQVLALIGDSALFGPSVRDRLIARTQAAVARMGSENGTVESVIGPLVSREAQTNRVELAAITEQLRAGLGTWLDKNFMKAVDPGPRGGVPARAGSYLWDLATLESAVAMVEEYALFDGRDANQFPRPLQGAVRTVALTRLGTNVLATVARAQLPLGDAGVRGRGEAELRAQVRSFTTALPLLTQLMGSLRQLGLPQSYTPVYDAAVGYATGLLGRLDESLYAEGFYLPPDRDLLAWTGGKAVPHQIYGLGAAPLLAEHLADTRQRVSTLARDFAEPLVEFLSRPDIRSGAASTGSVGRWTRILAELDKASGGRPANSVAALERFITTDLAEIDLIACAGSALRSGAEGGGDWFADRMRDIRDKLIKHCNMILDQQIAALYRTIAGQFNQSLAGRYPFSDPLDAFGGAQASADAVAEFYRVYDSNADVLLAALQGGARLGASGRQAHAFLNELKAARKLLGPLVGLNDVPDPSVLLDVKFRALTELEVGGSDVIDWRFQVGEAATDIRTKQTLTWRHGDPIAITFRWAKDGRLAPVNADSLADIAVDGRSLTYRFSGPWALLALLQQQLPNPKDWRAGAGRPPQMLAFSALTQTVPPDSEPKPKEKPLNPTAQPGPTAKLFIDLAIKPPSSTPAADGKPPKEERLGLPKFPRSAPDLFRSEPAVGQGPGGFPGLGTTPVPGAAQLLQPARPVR